MDLSVPISDFYRWAVYTIVLVIIKLIVDKALLVRAAFASIKDCPGRIPIWLRPFSIVALVAGDKFPRPGMGGYYAAKFSFYEKFGATVYSSVDMTNSRPTLWLADTEALKTVTSDRHTFQKDVTTYRVVAFCGENLVSLEGSDWKRHRAITMSAFNEANIALVWSETLCIVDKWFERLDTVGPNVSVDLVSAMEQITLLVIAHAGFGGRVSLAHDPTVQPPFGHQLTFASAFMECIRNNLFRMLTPGWFYQLSSLIKVPYLSSRALRTQLAFGELRSHMLDLVASARSEITPGESKGSLDATLLRNLVKANVDQDGDSKTLSEGELLSNVFIFLLAGHETTAHTLCFTMAFLALYPDSQKRVFKEVSRIWPSDNSLTQLSSNHKTYMDKLEYTTACIRESLRLFPAAPRVPRDVRADTVLPGTYFKPGSEGGPSVETGRFTVTIPAGSIVSIDIWGLHHNTLYWGEDAAEYKPERFLDTKTYQWPRNAFMPFMAGPRACIGQRFVLTEMIAVIGSVLRRYELRVPDDLADKPWGVQKETLLKWTTGVTLTPVNARVKLCRRV